MMKGKNLYLGIDGGGTKCVARLFNDEGVELGVGHGGPANAYQNLSGTQESILAAAKSALASASLNEKFLSEIVVGAGLAGVNIPSVKLAIQSWQHPFKKFCVTTDVHIACFGAHQRDTGSVLIVGTGTCGYARFSKEKNIEEFFIGGHGFPIGDQAGGAWIGFEAIKYSLLAKDHLIAATCLTEKIQSFWNISNEQLLDTIAKATPADYARLVPCVFEALAEKDPIAVSILNQAANYLEKLIEKLWAINQEPVVLIGGLSQSIKSILSNKHQSLLKDPVTSPEFGAYWWVKSELS